MNVPSLLLPPAANTAAPPGAPTDRPARRLPVGAEPAGAGTHFRVWAPDRRAVAVVIEGGAAHPLAPEGDGYFSALVPVGPGTRYRLRLDDADPLVPDPASRFQPDGPHGPSEVVDPTAFRWTDSGWPGVKPEGAIIYEMHISTFTPEGTW